MPRRLTVAKCNAAELCFIRNVNATIRALWFPGASAVLGPLFGTTVYSGDNMILNKHEMLDFIAVRQDPINGLLQVHYYVKFWSK